jgi:7,8-dihydropterin-6-yl-methyl-4-(beta-D-ribofuranosyl)aminobenzene 5'-phosphate synthase
MCVISHNHYDHSGGLRNLLEKGYSSPVYLHDTFFRKRFSIKNGNKVLSIGAKKDLLLTYDNINMISATVTEIRKDIFIFANIPFTNSFESIDKNFLIEREGTLSQDKFDDELVLAIKTKKGIVVISGCSHRGIINILDFIEAYFKEESIFAFVGGTHLLNASDYRLEKTRISLMGIGPSVLAACHCTGKRGISFLSEHFPHSFVRIKTGSVLNF